MPQCRLCGRDYESAKSHRDLLHPDRDVVEISGEPQEIVARVPGGFGGKLPTITQPPPQREPDLGKIRGVIKDKTTKKALEDPASVSAISPLLGNPLTVPTDKDSIYEIDVPAKEGGISYTVIASATGYKQPRAQRIVVQPGQTVSLDFELEPEKTKLGENVKKHAPILSGNLPGLNPRTWLRILNFEWFTKNLIRIALALGLTLLIYFAIYRPIFSAAGQNLGFVNWMIPVLLFFILFFTLPKSTDTTNLAPFILASGFAIGTWIALTFFTKGVGRASFIQWGIPMAVYLITYFTAKKEHGTRTVLIAILPLLLLIGGILLFVNLFTNGSLTNMETYLKPIDGLRLFGVPQDNIDDIKDGIRQMLSWLGFIGSKPSTPIAEKIGGFEAIQLKFGSKFNDFTLPTLFARLDYTLPVTVINPNKFDTKLVVRDFTLDDIFLLNKSTERILCGSAPSETTPNVQTGIINLRDINPEEEKIITIDFKGKSTNGISDTITDCRNVLNYKNRPPNSMFPATVLIPMSESDSIKCKDTNEGACIEVLDKFYIDFGITSQATSTDVEARYLNNQGACECKVNRYHNILDNLCFFSNDNAEVTVTSNYSFVVQGTGELILVRTESDIKNAPDPKITSSAGPLTITTYFVSDAHVPQPPSAPKTRTIFIQVNNDGEGTARISSLKINNDQPFDGITVSNCSPNPNNIIIREQATTITCGVNIPSSVELTGPYKTIPIIVDVNYTYSQAHKTTIKVNKEFISDSVNDQQSQELDEAFKGLPYYCPGPRSSLGALKIYDPSNVIVSSQYTNCKDKIDKGLGKCGNAEGGCTDTDECNTNAVSGTGTKLSCRDVGAEVKVCCWSDSTNQDCKNAFEN